MERSLTTKMGRDPTDDELAAALEMTPEKVKQIKKAGANARPLLSST